MSDTKINYRDLLKKYIDHVSNEEGTSFLGNMYRSRNRDSVEFTKEEWAELQKIDREVDSDVREKFRKKATT